MREFQIVSGDKGSKKRGRREREKGGKWQNEHGKRANPHNLEFKKRKITRANTKLKIDVKS